MKELNGYMKRIVDETGIPVQLVIRCEDGVFRAAVQENGQTLLDNQGDRFMSALGDDLGVVLSALERLAAIK